MSQQENEPELPLTSKVKPLNEGELQFVTFMHQMYSLEGVLLSKESALAVGIPTSDYDDFMADDRILNSLAERGIEVKGTSSSVVSLKEWQQELTLKSLSPTQLIIANTMLDLIDTRSQKKKLSDNGVATSTYNTWLKDPVFQGYMRTRAESMIGENHHEAHLALLDKIRMGDMKAIALYYEMTGYYVPVTAGQQNANQVAVNVQNLLVSIIEIINDEVNDPQIAANIADRFKSLMTATTIAGELTADVISQPERAASRVLTPELMALTNRGEGYE